MHVISHVLIVFSLFYIALITIKWLYTAKQIVMSNTFIQTGVYTEGCFIPVTIEDPCVKVLHDEYGERFRINIYVGNTWIDAITMDNYSTMCNDVSSLAVYSFEGEYLGNVWKLVQEQLSYVYARINYKSL
jgi:hypothetical protein